MKATHIGKGGWRKFDKGYDRVHDGHIIPLDDDSGLQECLDEHPEFVTARERKLAERLYRTLGSCPGDPEEWELPGGCEGKCEATLSTEAQAISCWLAWAKEGK